MLNIHKKVIQQEKDIIIRPIQRGDNAALAAIIKQALEEHGVAIPGTVYTDPTTDHLYDLFRDPRSVYFVAEENKCLLGGCGIFPTRGLPEGYSELVKLYLKNEARGQGIGRRLMETCIDWAKQQGVRYIYLETLNELASAVSLYKKLGFEELEKPLGESGHHACDIWMLYPSDFQAPESFDSRSPHSLRLI
jgi:putative acetyltransferase